MTEALPAGPDFGGYRLVRRLSLGGMAEIYEARPLAGPRHGEAVALKRLLPHAEEDPAIVRMFLHEARLVAQLDHAGLARVVEVGQLGPHPFLVMELLVGRDLAVLMRGLADAGERAPHAVVAALGQQVALALDYVHTFVDAQGTPLRIVHRDVSPHNLMVEATGRVRLIDFGVAKFVGGDESTAAGVVKGKHGYMSPEQVRQEALDGRSDVFSLGTVLYELATGERLFRGETVLDTLLRVEAADVPPLAGRVPELPAPLAAAITAALARDRSARPTAAALARVLREVEPSAPVAAVAAWARRVLPPPDAAPGQTLGAYRASLRAAELGQDPALAGRTASDITVVPDAGAIAAQIAAVRQALGHPSPPAAADSGARPPAHGARRPS